MGQLVRLSLLVADESIGLQINHSMARLIPVNWCNSELSKDCITATLISVQFDSPRLTSL